MVSKKNGLPPDSSYTTIDYISLLFDRTQLEYDDYGKVRKGRWGLDESEKWRTLNGISSFTCIFSSQARIGTSVNTMDKICFGVLPF